MQTNEDDIECETQTEETEVCDKWSQHPPEDFNCVGGTVYYVFKISKTSSILIRLMHESAISSHYQWLPRCRSNIADRECNCWFFFISTKFNGLIFNMEYAI